MNDGLVGLGGSAPSLIKDTGLETFTADVIDASQEVPVIAAFWTPEAEPCITLIAALEKVVGEAGGAVRMVRVNVHDNPEIAQQLRIQSVPTVFVFKAGQPVDGFAGALPEAQIKAFIEKQAGPLGPSPAEELIAQGTAALEAGDTALAEQAFGTALGHDADNLSALAGLIKTYTAMEDFERAGGVLEQVPQGKESDPEIAGARAALELAQQAANVDTSELSGLREKVAADAKDMDSHLALADVLLAIGEREEAVDILLTMIETDRTWADEEAREKLLTLFEGFGPTHELTLSGRRRLSSILFS
jgi:putative thioredoxin